MNTKSLSGWTMILLLLVPALLFSFGCASGHRIEKRSVESIPAVEEEAWQVKAAAAANNYALELMSDGQPGEAAALLRYSILLREPYALPGDPELANSWFNLGEALLQLATYHEAEACFLMSLGIDEARPEQMVDSLRRLAWVAQEFGRLDEAYEYLKEAQSILEEQLPDDKLGLAGVYNDWAAVQIDRKEFEGLEPVLLEAIGIEEKYYGGRTEHSLPALGHLATLYQKLGRLDEAETIALEVVAIATDAYGPEHLETALPLNNLGFIQYLQKDYAESEMNTETAIEIYRKDLNEGHPLLAFPLSNLGNVRLEQQRYVEAEELYTEALMLRIDSFGDEHRAVARSLLDLGKLYRLSGRMDEAEPLLQKALAIREEVYGPVDERVAAALEQYAELMKVTGRSEEAAGLLVRAERIRDQL